MKTIKELAHDAETVQNACNLSGILHGAADAMTELRRLAPGLSTGAYNHHPIMRAWAHKIADLSGLSVDGYPADELRAIIAAPDSDAAVKASTAANIAAGFFSKDTY